MDYISAREAANKWGISQRRVAVLCSEKRIKDALMVGNMWIIPSSSAKPIDARALRYIAEPTKNVKPFLKWAGGKSQLLPEIEKYYPFQKNNITKYAEPFVGGGAVLFDVLNKYNLQEIYIGDTNAELINTYKVVRDSVEELISFLLTLQDNYIPMSPTERKTFYLSKREKFNFLKMNDTGENIEKAALMIFLNRTCFNGLYRVNKKGFFNVPIGSYKNPLICDEKNLRAVSQKLQNVKIVCGDYTQSSEFIDKSTFVYFDPPYRPISNTANFTAYNETVFTDSEQLELAKFVDSVHNKGAKIIISNSDPKNVDTEDNFFDDIYSKYTINRIDANRMINCNGKSRGKIKELLISNF